MAEEHLYKIMFVSQGEVYEIYAREVTQGSLFGFVEIEELTFGSEDKVVVDPSKERIEREFAGVKRSYIPMHAIVRIDEVEKEGSARILSGEASEGNVHVFPTPIYTPRGTKE